MPRYRRSNRRSGMPILPTLQEQKENLKKLQETFPWDREGELDRMSRNGTHSPLGRAVHSTMHYRARSNQNSTSLPNPRFGSLANAVKKPLQHTAHDHKASAPQKPTKLTYISDVILRLRINFEDFEARNFLSEHLLKDYQSENLELAIDNFKESRNNYIEVLENIKKYLPLNQETRKIHKLFEDLLAVENILLNIYHLSNIKNRLHVTGENIDNILKHNIIPPKKILDKIYTHIKDNSLTYLGFEIAGSHAISRLSTIEPTRYTEQKALNNIYQEKFKRQEPKCEAHFTIMYLLSINGCEQARQSLEQFSLKLGVDTAVEVDTADRKAEPQKNIVSAPEARAQSEVSRRSKSPRELRQVSDSPLQNSLNRSLDLSSIPAPASPINERDLGLSGSVPTSRRGGNGTDPDATRVLNRKEGEAQGLVSPRDRSSSPESLDAPSFTSDKKVTRGLSLAPYSPLPQKSQEDANDSEERGLNNMSIEELRDRVKELERSNQVLREEKQVCENIAQDALSREDSWVAIGKKYTQLHNESLIRESEPAQTPNTNPQGKNAQSISQKKSRTH
ncbi:hypothetical protein N9O56_00295 [Rickettsiales bacterium]|nr:hypothetical protein [Rickettsiales bacterium]